MDKTLLLDFFALEDPFGGHFSDLKAFPMS